MFAALSVCRVKPASVVQVCLYTCGDLIANVPFFEDAEEGFTTSVVTLLRPVVSLAAVTPVLLLSPAHGLDDCELLTCCCDPVLSGHSSRDRVLPRSVP